MDSEIFLSITNLINSFDEIDKVIDSLPSILSNCDTKKDDLEHLLEIEKLDASQCWYFVKELQSIQKERRCVKNAMSYGQTFKAYINRLNNENNRKILLTELHKNKKRKDNEIKKDGSEIYSRTDLVNLKILKEEGVKKNEQ